MFPMRHIKGAIVVISLIICFQVLYKVFQKDSTHKFDCDQLWQSVSTEKNDGPVSLTSASSGAIFLGERSPDQLWQSVATENSNVKKGSPVSPISASSGAIFLGERTREFPRSAVRFESFEPGAGQDRRGRREKVPQPRCDKWGVVTTIFDVSEAVLKQV